MANRGTPIPASPVLRAMQSPTPLPRRPRIPPPSSSPGRQSTRQSRMPSSTQSSSSPRLPVPRQPISRGPNATPSPSAYRVLTRQLTLPHAMYLSCRLLNEEHNPTHRILGCARDNVRRTTDNLTHRSNINLRSRTITFHHIWAFRSSVNLISRLLSPISRLISILHSRGSRRRASSLVRADGYTLPFGVFPTPLGSA